MKIMTACFLLLCASDLYALAAQTTRVLVWRKGESIAAEEFIAMNEEIVDYLATLPRPTDSLKVFRYDCQVKSRLIRPSLQSYGSTTGQVQGWVEVRAVYALSDCKKID